MKKKISSILILGMLMTAIAGCQKAGSDETTTQTTAKTEQDDILIQDEEPLYCADLGKGEKEAFVKLDQQNNVKNYGKFACDGEWIYGQDVNTEERTSQLVKVRMDGTDYTVLDEGTAFNIFVQDGYIYYMATNGAEYGIYKMKANGEDKQLLVKAVGQMQVVGDYIYYYDQTAIRNPDYVVGSKDCYLYRCDLYGNNITEILSKPTFFFFVFDNGILYQDDFDKESLHVCKLDGSGEKKLNDDRSYWPIYDGEFIYYVKEAQTQSGVWKIRPDGSEDQLIFECDAYNLSLTKDSIYFIDGDKNDQLYCMNKDGSNLTAVSKEEGYVSPVITRYGVIYSKYTEDGSYIEGNYFCDFDGTKAKKLFESAKK